MKVLEISKIEITHTSRGVVSKLTCRMGAFGYKFLFKEYQELPDLIVMFGYRYRKRSWSSLKGEVYYTTFS